MFGGNSSYSNRRYRVYKITPKGILFNLIQFIMKKNGKNEELQSRREFFKKAAKGALPILGAIVLANAPAVLNAAEKDPMGCNYACSVGCGSACSGRCDGSCTDSCARGCSNYCNGGCNTTCRLTCQGYCHRSCTSVARY